MRVASSREDAWIETMGFDLDATVWHVASSREDAWIETWQKIPVKPLKLSRPPARTRGLKLVTGHDIINIGVASSREDAWIETSSNIR